MLLSGEGFEFKSPDRAFLLRRCQSCTNMPARNKIQKLSCTWLVYCLREFNFVGTGFAHRYHDPPTSHTANCYVADSGAAKRALFL
jgi:hypothetical protein